MVPLPEINGTYNVRLKTEALLRRVWLCAGNPAPPSPFPWPAYAAARSILCRPEETSWGPGRIAGNIRRAATYGPYVDGPLRSAFFCRIPDTQRTFLLQFHPTVLKVF